MECTMSGRLLAKRILWTLKRRNICYTCWRDHEHGGCYVLWCEHGCRKVVAP